MKKFSFVIPAFNEAKTIPQLYPRLVELMKKYEEDWEIIFINDGSRDDTVQVIKDLSEKDKRVKFIGLSRNFGHQAALSAGLDYAEGDAIISMDCDLQDPPEVIEEMIEKWKEGVYIVYARRKNFRKDNLIKRYASKIYYKTLDRFSSVKIPRNVGDFRLVDRVVLEKIIGMREKSRYLRGMVAWTGYRFAFVDYYRPDREIGDSGYSFSKLLKLGMDGLLNFSFLPLKIGFLLGIISIFTGTAFLTYMIGDIFITNAKYELYKFLTVVLFIFMGFMFMLMWLLGEYIGRIYDETRNRPLFVIEETKNIEKL